MSVSQAEPIRATVAVVGGFILSVIAIAVEAVPIAGLALQEDACGRAFVGIAALPFALVGGVLALGAAYLAALGRHSPHAVVVFALVVVAVGAAVTIVGVATGGAFESTEVASCFG